jgi:hypothetical protein
LQRFRNWTESGTELDIVEFGGDCVGCNGVDDASMAPERDAGPVASGYRAGGELQHLRDHVGHVIGVEQPAREFGEAGHQCRPVCRRTQHGGGAGTILRCRLPAGRRTLALALALGAKVRVECVFLAGR